MALRAWLRPISRNTFMLVFSSGALRRAISMGAVATSTTCIDRMSPTGSMDTVGGVVGADGYARGAYEAVQLLEANRKRWAK